MNQTIASVDIGTNTVLLTIAQRSQSDGSLTILEDFHSIARLGQGVDSVRIIQQDAFLRAESILLKYRELCTKYEVGSIRAVGTSCLRDAANRDEVCLRLSQTLGARVEVISGDEEARLCFLGSIENDFPTTIVDIGGGSTELISGKDGEIEYRTSIDIGAVRLTERYFKELPPSKENVNQALQDIKQALAVLPRSKMYALRAVAGTPTTLAAMVLKMPDFNADAIHNFQLYYEDIQTIASKLSQLTLAEIITIPGVHPGRADILLAGVLILTSIMEYSSQTICTVSTKGLRYGVLKEMAKLLQ